MSKRVLLHALVAIMFFALHAPAPASSSRNPLSETHRIFASTLTSYVYTAASRYDCGPLRCTWTWQVEHVHPDPLPPFTFEWAGINLSGNLPGFEEWTATHWDILGLKPNPQPHAGAMTFQGLTGVPNASSPMYYDHPATVTPQQPYGLKDYLNDVGDSLFATSTRDRGATAPPVLAAGPAAAMLPGIEFVSTVELIAAGTYRYGYEVINRLDTPIVFTWDALGLSDVGVDAMDTYMMAIVSTLLPFETYGYIESAIAGDPFSGLSGPATTIVGLNAVPLPAAVWLFAGAVGLLGRARRDRIERNA